MGVRIPSRGFPGGPRDRVELTRGHGFDLRFRGPDDIGLIYEALVSSDLSEFDLPVAHDLDDDATSSSPRATSKCSPWLATSPRGLPIRAKGGPPLGVPARRGRFQYTTDMPDTGKRAPLEFFLFEGKQGHCEYFATALAIMLRAVGIPSRNVNGFVGGRFNPYGGYYGIRQADAHSWVEARMPGRGWVTLDPTPATRMGHGPNDWLLRDLSAMVDAARAYWMTKVVGYDVRTQLRFLREVQAFMREIEWPSFDWKKQTGGTKKAQTQGGDALSQLPSRLAIGLLFVVGLLLVLRALRKRAASRGALPESARKAQALYRELERALQKKGKARPVHVSPEAHARSLEQEGFVAAAQVRELTEAYTAARYGGRALSRERMAELHKRLAEVKRAA